MIARVGDEVTGSACGLGEGHDAQTYPVLW